MTNASEATADTRFQRHAERGHDSGSGPSDVRGRLFEVAVWVWRIVAVGIAFWVMAAAMVFYVEYGRVSDVAGIFGIYAVLAVAFTLMVWTTRYVVWGEKVPFGTLLKRTVFGNLPLYFWFVPGVLYFGGMFTSFWYDASDDALRLQDFAEGVGSTVVALMLGAAGGVIAPKKWMYVGHMIGTVIAIAAILGAWTYIP